MCLTTDAQKKEKKGDALQSKNDNQRVCVCVIKSNKKDTKQKPANNICLCVCEINLYRKKVVGLKVFVKNSQSRI